MPNPYHDPQNGQFTTRSNAGAKETAVLALRQYQKQSKNEGSTVVLHRGVGFNTGTLPDKLENRIETVLSGGSDESLGSDVLEYLNASGLGDYWALNPTIADVSGRQVNFRGQSDIQIMMTGTWDETGHEQSADVDPHYRKMNDNSNPVNVKIIKIRRTPAGSWMTKQDDGWVSLTVK